MMPRNILFGVRCWYKTTQKISPIASLPLATTLYKHQGQFRGPTWPAPTVQ